MFKVAQIRRLFNSDHFMKMLLPLHLLFLVSLVLLFLQKGAFELWLIPVFWVLLSGFGVSVGYHRLLAHRAFQTSTFWRRVVSFIGVMAGQGSPIAWVSIHRSLHHPFSDQERDPHSPTRGWLHSYWDWQIDFAQENINVRYALDLVRDPFIKWLSVHYYKVYWGTYALVLFANWRIAIFAMLPAMMLANHQENAINTFCHNRRLGYRNFDLSDESVNIWLMGLFCWGQGWHNNHHRYPDRADFAIKDWEFDPTRPLIWLIRSRAPKSTRESSRSTAVTQTL